MGSPTAKVGAEQGESPGEQGKPRYRSQRQVKEERSRPVWSRTQDPHVFPGWSRPHVVEGQDRLSGTGWSSLGESSEYCCTTFFLALCFYLSFLQKEETLLSALWTTLPHKGSPHTVLVTDPYSCAVTFTSLTCPHGQGQILPTPSPPPAER